MVALIKNFLTFGTVFVLRKKEGYNPVWKMPAWRFMAIIAMFATSILIVSTFMWAPMQGIIAAVLIVVTGLPAFHYWESKNKKSKNK